MKKSIWFKDYTVQQANDRSAGTMAEALGIDFTEVAPNYIRATMPVDHRTKQPAGILNGGASIALAETVASTAANMVVDNTRYVAVGLEINGNHIRPCTGGFVTGTAKPVHLGTTTQVWEVRVEQDSKLVCLVRFTVAVLERKRKPQLKVPLASS